MIAVLVVTAVMAIVIGSLSFKVDQWREQTADLQRWADEQRSEHNALAAALHALGTQPPGPGGWGPITAEPSGLMRGDAREYSIEGSARLAVQDGRGLLSLDVVDASTMKLALGTLGIPAPRVDAMIDILEDYQDVDNLKRLNGAEKSEYEALGLPPPRNDWVIAQAELGSMPVWREEMQHWPQLKDWLTPRRSAGLNPNTMPLTLVRALLPNAPAEILANFDQLRRARPFLDEADMLRQTGLRIGSADTVLWVGNQIVLRVRAANSQRAHEYNVLLTPRRLKGPWMILERHPARATISDADKTPARFPFAGSADAEPAAMAATAR